MIKGATEAPRLVYVNEKEQRKQNEPKVEKPRKLPRGKEFWGGVPFVIVALDFFYVPNELF